MSTTPVLKAPRLTPRPDWLASVAEAPLDPDLAICDAHHHLWDQPDHPYFAADYEADFGGHRVVASVHVEVRSAWRVQGPEALRPVGETQMAEAVAASAAARGGPRLAAAIVAYADLRLGAAVAEVLDAHAAASRRLRGIRQACAFDEDPEVWKSWVAPSPRQMADARFREGFAQLAPRGLSFDAWLFHPQIPALADLARAFPDTTIVLDHVGAPLGVGRYSWRRAEILETWKKSVAELARCPNVRVKLGGLGMTIGGFGWHEGARPPGSAELAEAFRPYLLHCIDCFGVERCMFESNFPVDKVSYSGGVMWNAFKRIAAGFSDAERRALFHDTAVRTYGIESRIE